MPEISTETICKILQHEFVLELFEEAKLSDDILIEYDIKIPAGRIGDCIDLIGKEYIDYLVKYGHMYFWMALSKLKDSRSENAIYASKLFAELVRIDSVPAFASPEALEIINNRKKLNQL